MLLLFRNIVSVLFINGKNRGNGIWENVTWQEYLGTWLETERNMEGTQQECGRKMTGGKKHGKRTTGSLEG